MTRRLLTILAAALVQACASTPPPAEPQPPAEAQPQPQPQAEAPAGVVAAPPPAAQPAEPVAPPVPSPAQAALPETAKPPQAIKQIDATAGSQDVWQRVRQGFAIPDLNNDLVRKHVAYYKARPDYLQRIFDRSRLYLYHIVAEIERRGLPTELALLPMVESAFNPMAYSRAHASGLWQFIPGTGKRFELQQNWWYDGRRDIVDSTDAALDYLTKLYKIHGDWQLALASYNWGENAVSRAVAKNKKARKPTDYSHLKMPKETRQYVPKLQALKNIIADPAKYGIELTPIPNEPYFTVLTESLAVDVALAARLAEMPVEDFIALNPGLSRPFIRNEGTRIVLPADKVAVFRDNLSKQDPGSLVSWETYHPEKGETLAKIADKFGLSVAELRRVNGIDTHSSRVPQQMVVPTEAEAALVSAKLPIMYAPPVAEVRHVHRVKSGDTLSGIAKRYHVRVSDLKRWNQGVGLLRINQKIYIRAG
ncbi:MAG TPA: transglycosylase SLT domain-containing protein [Burkholderiales bacterium]|jgi:membrane-bound lytic murein transglycosylase D|nr:transglycosylase SLT domain-containing protein [Burkholderiales bacterium]